MDIGINYVYRWVRIINKLEKQIKIDKEKYLFQMYRHEIKYDDKTTKLPKFLDKKSTVYMKYLMIAISVFWDIIFLLGIFRILQVDII